MTPIPAIVTRLLTRRTVGSFRDRRLARVARQKSRNTAYNKAYQKAQRDAVKEIQASLTPEDWATIRAQARENLRRKGTIT